MRKREIKSRRKRRGRGLAAVSLPRDGVCSVSLFTSVLGYVCVNSGCHLFSRHFDHHHLDLDCDAGFMSRGMTSELCLGIWDKNAQSCCMLIGYLLTNHRISCWE